MKKLSENDLKEKLRIIDLLNDAKGDVDQAFALVEKEIDMLNEAIRVYNEGVAAANEWCEEIASSIEEYMSERSDKWRESDAGENYASWLTKWQYDLPELDPVDAPDQPGTDDVITEIEELPEEPES